jgi:hypothetical protein
MHEDRKWKPFGQTNRKCLNKIDFDLALVDGVVGKSGVDNLKAELAVRVRAQNSIARKTRKPTIIT